MNESNANNLNAVSGQFRTLDGVDYIGPYHITWQGLPMTESHPSPTSRMLVPDTSSLTSQSDLLQPADLNTTLDENETTYDLIPVIINRPPIVTKTITEGSDPPIRPYAEADGTGRFMYEFPDGLVKVQRGATIRLRVEAQQPDVLNVENGQLVMKPHSAELVYSWTLDADVITGNRVDSSGNVLLQLNNNELTIINAQPQFAGTYTCTVTNDIGTTDAGTVTLEIYNADIDSFFYSNLVESPNGESADSWNSINDDFTSREMTPTIRPNVLALKSIVTDPLNPPFAWARAMLKPNPDDLDVGSLRDIAETLPGAARRYYTRSNYTYTVNGGTSITKAYQEIDLSALQDHIKGAVYGVEGLRAIFCAYVGNGIFNYEPNSEFVLPSQRASTDAYYLGAPRVSAENFTKAGPGFVQEKIYVTLEEYWNGQQLKSRILEGGVDGGRILIGIPTIQDPWTARLPRYEGRVYYEGGKGLTYPDEPSLGDRRDAHLFVADELTPDVRDRFSYGQCAEFQKQVIERLDPRTNKVRITITIEATGLGLNMRERGDEKLPTDISQMWEVLPWTSTWAPRSFRGKNDDSWPDPKNAFTNIANSETYKPGAPLEEKIPKMGVSRSFVTGLVFALYPIKTFDRAATDAEVAAALDLVGFETLAADIPPDDTTLDESLPPYNAVLDINSKKLELVQQQLTDIPPQVEKIRADIDAIQEQIDKLQQEREEMSNDQQEETQQAYLENLTSLTVQFTNLAETLKQLGEQYFEAEAELKRLQTDPYYV